MRQILRGFPVSAVWRCKTVLWLDDLIIGK
uniref:Uncharacterized protein n=1 Tax=Podoviridae sp. ct2iq11 TaxID=2827720 RepID=A0A8S5TPI8_9CAUD|nr:MAG TPA: hypothetical protein [Podoviridae sp. ct2iq11]